MQSLADQVIVVTGAGSGMGAATARRLAAEGARVVLVGRHADALDAVAAEIAASGGRAYARASDITDADAMAALVDWVHAELGGVDVLVNNAGASSLVRNPLYLPEDQLAAVLHVNLVAVFRLVRLVLPDMLARGSGTILTVSSVAALSPGILGGAAYGAAKAAVRNFMTFLHNTFRAEGLRAITVLPGEADTPILDKRPRPPEPAERVDMLQPEDVAEAISMALRLPARACAQEIVLYPTRPRDTSVDVAMGLLVGAPESQPEGDTRAGLADSPAAGA